mmetsp:Transcript_38420/g.109819  ORF Transcript_38420/g.109819 Transcript_38420/m.109819 type:complete len:366 (+) Transcript_38420:536-1633(+)
MGTSSGSSPRRRRRRGVVWVSTPVWTAGAICTCSGAAECVGEVGLEVRGHVGSGDVGQVVELLLQEGGQVGHVGTAATATGHVGAPRGGPVGPVVTDRFGVEEAVELGCASTGGIARAALVAELGTTPTPHLVAALHLLYHRAAVRTLARPVLVLVVFECLFVLAIRRVGVLGGLGLHTRHALVDLQTAHQTHLFAFRAWEAHSLLPQSRVVAEERTIAAVGTSAYLSPLQPLDEQLRVANEISLLEHYLHLAGLHLLAPHDPTTTTTTRSGSGSRRRRGRSRTVPLDGRAREGHLLLLHLKLQVVAQTFPVMCAAAPQLQAQLMLFIQVILADDTYLPRTGRAAAVHPPPLAAAGHRSTAALLI